VSAANDAVEKSYRVVGNTGHWAVAEDGAEPAGDYATREGALEVIYLAASNDIKSGHGVTIRIEPPPPDAPATDGKPQPTLRASCFVGQLLSRKGFPGNRPISDRPGV
jgi:hypothetical protein